MLQGENGVHDKFHRRIRASPLLIPLNPSMLWHCSADRSLDRTVEQCMFSHFRRKEKASISVAEHFLPFFCVCEHGLVQGDGDLWAAGCLLTIRVPAQLRCLSVFAPNCNLPFFFLPLFCPFSMTLVQFSSGTWVRVHMPPPLLYSTLHSRRNYSYNEIVLMRNLHANSGTSVTSHGPCKAVRQA
jgi:hypothetical protein